MKRRSTKFNPKRRLIDPVLVQSLQASLHERSAQVRYGGNPEHKKAPGDFGLTPPASPRPGKSLCDDAGIFHRDEALALLKTALRLGPVSTRFEGEWPYNIWAVTESGIALEAQWEAEGVYHGYPMPENDPLRDAVLDRWSAARE